MGSLLAQESQPFVFNKDSVQTSLLSPATLQEQTEKQDEVKNQHKLDQLLNKCEGSLLQIYGVFPFDLFPDKVIVDMNKVNVVYNEFMAYRVQSISIQDILDVYVEANPFFATLKIIDKGLGDESTTVRFLKVDEAHKARRLIQGLILTTKQSIDLTKIHDEDLSMKLEEIGKTKEIGSNAFH